MAVSLMYMPIMVFRDSNDTPIPGARIFSFAAGTTTPLSLWADANGVTPLSNPAVADASGRLVAYMLTGSAYKIDTFDALGVHVPGWPIDNITVTPAGNPTQIDDASSTVTEGNATADPGEPGSEVLATNLAEELKQLRFRIQEITGASTWRVSYNVRRTVGAVTSTSNDGTWPEGAQHTFFFTHVVPDGYQAGSNITFSVFLRGNSVGGQARMTYQAYRVRHLSPFAIGASGDVDFPVTDVNDHRLDILIAGGMGFQALDVIRIDVSRLGNIPAQDTNTGAVAMDGHFFTYTGIGGR